MKFNNKLHLVCSFLLLLQSSLFAQNAEKKNKISLKVDLVSLSETIPGLYLGKKEGKQVDALAFQYNKTIKYNGPHVIHISQGSTQVANVPKGGDEEHSTKPLTAKDLPQEAAVSDGTDKELDKITKLREENPALVALAKVPSGSRHVTILLIPGPSNTYRTLVFDDDPSKMPYGKMRIHNFCKVNLGLEFSNAKAAVIKPMKDHIVGPDKYSTVRYSLKYAQNKKWRPVESNITRVTPDQQVRMLVLNSKSSYFRSSNGSRGGRLQIAVLRRDRSDKPPKKGGAVDDDKPPLPSGL